MSEHCERYEERISAWLDGELTDREAEELRDHLTTCPRCRAFLAALTDLSDGLNEALPDPPASLVSGVMDRIMAENDTGDDAGAPIDIRRARTASRRRGRVLAAAACLALVLGGAWFGLNRFRAPHAAQVAESITLEAAGAPVPQPEKEMDTDGTAVSEDADTILFPQDALGMPDEGADHAEMEESAEYGADLNGEQPMAALDAGSPVVMEESSQRPATASARHPVYTWDNPAHIQAGRETDFAALIGAVAWPEGVSAEDLTLISAVEYNGIIYEFLTDPGGSALFWRDAAESVDPIPAAGTPEELWDMIG